ncbi:hypothetical protein LZ30DRAFT_72294 [Colletotrichum cereale]|nr:hypothetical protein LZ30DRAFT_72294 [Colletotrichum cereale]
MMPLPGVVSRGLPFPAITMLLSHGHGASVRQEELRVGSHDAIGYSRNRMFTLPSIPPSTASSGTLHPHRPQPDPCLNAPTI